MPGSVEYTGMRTVRLPTRGDVEAALERVRPHLAPTPVVESEGFALKLESLQPTGSFKVRGAVAALAALDQPEPVVTASAGNHGLAVAWAAQRLGFDATIVVAETASPAKIEGIRRFPATLVVHGADYDEAERHALSLPGRYVSPYNDPDVIAGAGTTALELIGFDTIVVPVGGGGLVSGVALAGAGEARVVGVVPEAFPAMRAALDAGRIVQVEGERTIADGLHGNIEPGSVTFELVRERVEDVVTVSDAAIEEAMRFLASEHGLVTEGAGAAAVAALRSGATSAHGRTVAIVTGRNITAARFAEVLDGGARAGG
jgi:threonine dehydratase